MGTAKDVCEAVEAELGFGPLAGPADSSVKTAGGEVALTAWMPAVPAGG